MLETVLRVDNLIFWDRYITKTLG